MPGKLDLTLAPWTAVDPTVARGHALYRDSPFAVTLEFFEADGTTPRDLSAGSFQAQLRTTRLKGATAGTPLAQFAVDDTDAATGVLVLSLTRTQTRDLALRAGTDAFWELQNETSGDTLMTGKARIFDDAGRPV